MSSRAMRGLDVWSAEFVLRECISTIVIIHGWWVVSKYGMVVCFEARQVLQFRGDDCQEIVSLEAKTVLTRP